MRFIRDDIPVRQLDKRYKRTIRRMASMTASRMVGYSWHTRYKVWDLSAALEKVMMRGA